MIDVQRILEVVFFLKVFSQFSRAPFTKQLHQANVQNRKEFLDCEAVAIENFRSVFATPFFNHATCLA